jgi:hypothetical protein
VLERPSFPTKKLFGVIAATANLIALVLWFRMHQPLAWKLGVGGGEALVAVFIIGCHIGEQRMFVRANRTIKPLERELSALEEMQEASVTGQRRAA